MNEQLYQLWLAAVLGPGCGYAGRVLELYGTARNLFEARDTEDFSALLKPAAVARLHSLQPEQFAPLAQQCRSAGIRILAWEEEDYPLAYTRIPDPPAVLYCTGDVSVLNGQTYVGMVGSRRPTQYGVSACAALGREMARAGVVLVSGLADGLDGEAHRAALAEGRPTVGILGTPIDKTYPAGNRQLRAQMEQCGCVISEYPPGSESGRHQFLQRNRLIAALSDALCVVEARSKSGTANTVQHALGYGTPVYAVPGSIFSALSQGSNEMLRAGTARMLCTAADVLEPLGLAGPATPAAAPAKMPPLGETARQLLGLLGPQQKALDELCTQSGLSAGAALAALTELELAGLATPLAGRRYIRTE